MIRFIASQARRAVAIAGAGALLALGAAVPPAAADQRPFECPVSEGRFPNPEDPHSFYRCISGVAFLSECPVFTHFNPEIIDCDWPENVEAARPTGN